MRAPRCCSGPVATRRALRRRGAQLSRFRSAGTLRVSTPAASDLREPLLVGLLGAGQARMARCRGPRRAEVVVEDVVGADETDALTLGLGHPRRVGLGVVGADAEDREPRLPLDPQRVGEPDGTEVHAVVVGHGDDVDPGRLHRADGLGRHLERELLGWLPPVPSAASRLSMVTSAADSVGRWPTGRSREGGAPRLVVEVGVTGECQGHRLAAAGRGRVVVVVVAPCPCSPRCRSSPRRPGGRSPASCRRPTTRRCPRTPPAATRRHPGPAARARFGGVVGGASGHGTGPSGRAVRPAPRVRTTPHAPDPHGNSGNGIHVGGSPRARLGWTDPLWDPFVGNPRQVPRPTTPRTGPPMSPAHTLGADPQLLQSASTARGEPGWDAPHPDRRPVPRTHCQEHHDQPTTREHPGPVALPPRI